MEACGVGESKMTQIHLRFFPERPFDGDGHRHISMTTCGKDIEFEVLGEHWRRIKQKRLLKRRHQHHVVTV